MCAENPPSAASAAPRPRPAAPAPALPSPRSRTYARGAYGVPLAVSSHTSDIRPQKRRAIYGYMRKRLSVYLFITVDTVFIE